MRKFLLFFGCVIIITAMVFSYRYAAQQDQANSVKMQEFNTMQEVFPQGVGDETEEQQGTSSKTEKQMGLKNLEVLATMEESSNAKNQVWAGTFQLVWNDFINELLKGPAKFVDGNPLIADQLNKQSFSVADLSPAAYYKKWGLVSPKLKQEIAKGIKEKFNETSDILDQFDWTAEPDKYFLYAMLKKDFQFVEKFQKRGFDTFGGSEDPVEYFGADDLNAKSSVWVLFYNGKDDFAVRLQSKQGSLAQLYQKLKGEILAYSGNNVLKENDDFKAPMLDFNVERDFSELCGKVISPNWIISQALETIQFKMDEAGVKLKSEAGMMVMKRAIMERSTPRYFYFNDRYAVFIAEKGKKPYFALLVEDAAELQKLPQITSQNRDAAQAKFVEGLEAYNQGDYEIALRTWTEAKQLDPSSPDVEMALGKVKQMLGR